VLVTTAHGAIPKYVPIRPPIHNPAYSTVVTPLTPAGAVKLSLRSFQRLERCVLVVHEEIDRPIQFRAYHRGIRRPFAFDKACISRSSVPIPGRIVIELSHEYLPSGVCAVKYQPVKMAQRTDGYTHRMSWQLIRLLFATYA
jgi:hypothetical protein